MLFCEKQDRVDADKKAGENMVNGIDYHSKLCYSRYMKKT